jgi:hypothetical protein
MVLCFPMQPGQIGVATTIPGPLHEPDLFFPKIPSGLGVASSGRIIA